MAVTVDVAATDGTRTGSIELDATVFGIQPNVPVLHQVVTAQLAAARRGTQSTKTRAEVSGGGKKPFKQKGTGRARQGSERAPQFTGGGIALGPKPRSYRQRTPRKMIALALRSALSDRASEGKVKVIESWGWDAPSTRAARSALGALSLDGRILIVVSPDDDTTTKSFRNLPEVQLLRVGELNAYDILVNDWIVFSRDVLPGETAEVDSAGTAKATKAKAATAKTATVEAATPEAATAEVVAASDDEAGATTEAEEAGDE